MIDTKFCIFCGVHEPEYTVKEYTRKCNSCGEGVVLSINEAIDLINSLKSKGFVTEDMLSCVSEQDYERGELDFDDDLLSVEQAIAREDAMRDIYGDEEEY